MFFIKTGRARRHHFLGASWRGRPHAACLCSDSAQTPGENLNSLFCTWIPNAGSLHSSPRRHPLGLRFPEQLSSVPRQVILGMILQFDLTFIEMCAGFLSVRLPGKQRIPVFKAFLSFSSSPQTAASSQPATTRPWEGGRWPLWGNGCASVSTHVEKEQRLSLNPAFFE